MTDVFENARNFYEMRRFAEAYAELSSAAELGAEELELLGLSAYLSGHEEELIEAFDRAHRAHLEAGSAVRAARCAFWIGLLLLVRGEAGASSGWLARARRLLGEQDSVEQGYLLLPIAEREILAGDCEAAARAAGEAAAIGERFGDADLTACARHVRGRALMLLGRGEPGLALLDDAMLAVTSGELSPLMTGLIYCSVIDACQALYVFGRAREWTLAMARW